MQNFKKKKVLILGAGFAGCTAAYLLKNKGFDVTVIEKDELPGGGCRTYFYGGHPYTLGPRVFFTEEEEVIRLMSKFTKIRQFYGQAKSYIEGDRKFYQYPIYEGDLKRMPDKKEIFKQLKERRGKKPSFESFESYWLDVIGPNLYYKFIDDYSKKMWGVKSNKELSADFKWINKGNPIRQKDKRMWGDMFQGYPYALDGYNKVFDKMLSGCKFISECEANHLNPKTGKVSTKKGEFKGDIIVNTLSVDSLFENRFGELGYIGRDLINIVLPVNSIFERDVLWNYYSSWEPYTRVTEFKKITNFKSSDTLIGVEIPSKNGKYYPVQNSKEERKFLRYKEIFPKNFYSIGRMGNFSYTSIAGVMRAAIELVKIINL